MKQIKILGVLLFSAAAAFFLDGAELILQPLFNSCSVYFKTDVPKDVSVFYREKGSRKWLPAFETVFDRNFGGVHRTGIVDLKSGTEYEVKAQCSHRRQKAEVIKTFKTWSEDVPVAKRIVLKPEEVKNGFVIRDKGTPEGWSPWVQFCNCLIFCIFQLLNNLQLKILLHNVGDLWSSFFTDDIKR